MAILAKCPTCHRKMRSVLKKCPKCGQNMDSAKSSGRVLYYIAERINGKQIQTPCGNKITDAQDLQAERRSLKNKGRLIDAMAGKAMTAWTAMAPGAPVSPSLSAVAFRSTVGRGP